MKITNIFKSDKVIWMLFFCFCFISILEVFSSTSTLTYKTSNYWAPVTKHIKFLIMGFVLMVLLLHTNYKYLKSFNFLIYGGTIIALLWVLLMGQTTNGATRWVSLFGFQFQPSEFAKGVTVLTIAKVMSSMQTETETHENPRTLKFILFAILPILFLIGLENLSTAALLFLVALAMAFVGGVPLRQIGKVFGALTILGVIVLGLVFLAGNKADTAEAEQEQETTIIAEEADNTEKAEPGTLEKMFHRAATWRNRITDFVEGGEKDPKLYKINDKNRQVSYANIAIVKSGIKGKGVGNSWARDYLPQAYSDFIYAIVLEELGIVGGILVVIFYLWLLQRASSIARRCEDYYSAMLAMGLAILMVTQAMFNMMVAVGLAPVTGQPLPFISRGGSSTLANCIYIGIILSIGYFAPRKKKANISEAAQTKERE